MANIDCEQREAVDLALAWTPLRVQRRVVIDPETGCWVWQDRFNQAGYGVVAFGAGSVAVYVLLWGLRHGDVPGDGDGMCLDHLCRNRACCNPDHLEVVTIGENTRRGDTIIARNASRTHCPQGHPYSGDNLYSHPRKAQRSCRICIRESGARYRAKRKKINSDG